MTEKSDKFIAGKSGVIHSRKKWCTCKCRQAQDSGSDLRTII